MEEKVIIEVSYNFIINYALIAVIGSILYRFLLQITYGRPLKFKKYELDWTVLLHTLLELSFLGVISYCVFLIANDRIKEAKTIFTIILTLAASYLLRKGLDKSYKNDKSILENTEKIRTLIDNINESSNCDLTLKKCESFETRIHDLSNQSYDFLKFWLPETIAYLGSIYFIWFGGKW